MRRRLYLLGVLGAGALLAVGALLGQQPAQAAPTIMDFNNLTASGAETPTYSQNGLTLSFPTAGHHFHPTPGLSTTAATFFAFDGSPATFTAGAVPFSFLSVIVTEIDGPITFTANPSGTTQTVSTTGPVTFGPAFQRVTSVTMTTSSGIAELDDIRFDPAPPADLVVSKTDSPDPVIAGSNLTYTITGTNNGPGDSVNPTLAETVPAGTTFVSITPPSGWTCPTQPAAGGTGPVRCTRTNLAPSDGAQVFTMVVKVNTDLGNGATITNTASLQSPSTPDNSPTANHTDTETTTVNTRADLSVTKTDSPDPVKAGENVTYTIDVQNAGPSDAQNASLSDALPANTTFVSLTSPTGWTCQTPDAGSGGTVTCARQTGLSPTAGTQTFTLVVNVNADVSNGSVITNSATVGSVVTTDPDASNNTVEATTEVENEADLSVQKSCPAGPVVPGDQFGCTITVANSGPSAAQNVVVSDTLPAGETLVGTPSGGGFTCGTGSSFTCTLASLPAGDSRVITYTVRVGEDVAGGGALTNNVSVRTSTAETSTTNNSASATTTLPACTIDFRNASTGQTIRGTTGPDVICGSAFSDTIQGLDGADIIFGNGGDDSIQGGAGDDRLFGGAGNDTLSGPPGIDDANGGSGSDRCIARRNTNCEQAQVA